LFEDCAIVLMDEPFSALDAITRTQLQALTARVLKHRTVLMITHDPLEAIRLGDDIRILDGKPARMSASIRLDGVPPRPTNTKAVWQHHEQLLTQLMDRS